MSIALLSVILSAIFGIPAIWFIFPIARAWLWAIKGFGANKYKLDMTKFLNLYFVAWTTNNLNWVWGFKPELNNTGKRYYELIKW